MLNSQFSLRLNEIIMGINKHFFDTEDKAKMDDEQEFKFHNVQFASDIMDDG